MNFQEQPLPPDRAKVCNKCREFLILFPYNEANERLEAKFDVKHRNHTVSIINIRELDLGQYKRFESEKEVAG